MRHPSLLLILSWVFAPTTAHATTNPCEKATFNARKCSVVGSVMEGMVGQKKYSSDEKHLAEARDHYKASCSAGDTPACLMLKYFESGAPKDARRAGALKELCAKGIAEGCYVLSQVDFDSRESLMHKACELERPVDKENPYCMLDAQNEKHRQQTEGDLPRHRESCEKNYRACDFYVDGLKRVQKIEEAKAVASKSCAKSGDGEYCDALLKKSWSNEDWNHFIVGEYQRLCDSTGAAGPCYSIAGYLLRRDAKRGRSILEKLCASKSPMAGKSCFRLAEFLRKDGQTKEASGFYKKGCALHEALSCTDRLGGSEPQTGELFIERAQRAFEAGKLDAASSELEHAEEYKLHACGATRFIRGEILAARGNLEQAKKQFTEARDMGLPHCGDYAGLTAVSRERLEKLILNGTELGWKAKAEKGGAPPSKGHSLVIVHYNAPVRTAPATHPFRIFRDSSAFEIYAEHAAPRMQVKAVNDVDCRCTRYEYSRGKEEYRLEIGIPRAFRQKKAYRLTSREATLFLKKDGKWIEQASGMIPVSFGSNEESFEPVTDTDGDGIPEFFWRAELVDCNGGDWAQVVRLLPKFEVVARLTIPPRECD